MDNWERWHDGVYRHAQQEERKRVLIIKEYI
jgi:hypothetical protein